MSSPSLTILAIGDLHYTGLARQTAQMPPCRGDLARSLLKKVFLRVKHMGVQPDLVVVLGDLIEDGTDPRALQDIAALHGELTRCGIPFIVLRGNHDVPTKIFNERIGTAPGLYETGGYGFVVFDDDFADSHECTRTRKSFQMLDKIREEHPGLPLVALQHAPIYPPIDSHYPYRPVNAAAIMESYEKAGVLLSLSGHWHEGQKVRVHEGVAYHTVAALGDAPFSFSIVRLNGKKVDVQEETLALKLPNVIDVHCHTEYAYCGTTIDTPQAMALSEALGLPTLCITEHSFQLYFDKKEAMRFNWKYDEERVAQVFATPNRGRMVNYKRFARSLRSENIKLGLEVDLYGDGKLLLAPEDEDGWDVIVGAVHKVNGVEMGKTPQAEAEKLFIRDVQALLDNDVHVLAHPFRFFDRFGYERPKHLYEEVANLLADNGVAVEVNFHTYCPDPAFIRLCADKGVKIAFASDSHDLAEVAEFWPHLNALRQAGIQPKNFTGALFSLRKTEF